MLYAKSQGRIIRCALKRICVQAMAAQGSGGAYEISQRMTAAVGWGATAAFKDDWVWDQAAATYALDPVMAATLRKNNPQVRLSAHGVGQLKCMRSQRLH